VRRHDGDDPPRVPLDDELVVDDEMLVFRVVGHRLRKLRREIGELHLLGHGAAGCDREVHRLDALLRVVRRALLDCLHMLTAHPPQIALCHRVDVLVARDRVGTGRARRCRGQRLLLRRRAHADDLIGKRAGILLLLRRAEIGKEEPSDDNGEHGCAAEHSNPFRAVPGGETSRSTWPTSLHSRSQSGNSFR
jgi:hypothetical protein